MAPTQQPVTVSLRDLESSSVSFQTLQEAFGPTSLGILIVKDLPEDFQRLRLILLSFASYLAQLPSDQLDLLTNPEAHYNVGWSHGKEALKSEKYDTMKGSYYATIMSSYLQSCHQATERQPTFEWPNIWPQEDLLPGFRQTFEELCTLIIDIALLVARACDLFAAETVEEYVSGTMERIVKESMTIRARLLHYFPPSGSSPDVEEDGDSWCALHVDDGCLTGLTSALFVDESTPLPPLTSTFKPVHSFHETPDPLAGLYIRSRTSEVVKVNIPANRLAFQTGSALEKMTGGALKAVPHFVRGPNPGNAVARNTLAVFTQPNLMEVVDLQTGMTFGEHIRLSDEQHA
ncbi:Clavaminate synthase-like protein [Stipitochalara longipes BDJ]|nr:Clavaminate synthase-like protein [Stipitochalara longipes BDJ]